MRMAVVEMDCVALALSVYESKPFNRSYLCGRVGLIGQLVRFPICVALVLPQNDNDPSSAPISKGQKLKISLFEEFELFLGKV